MRDIGDRTALTRVFENVLLFVPAGVLLGACLRGIRNLWMPVVLGAIASAAIEASQALFVPGRSPSVDDVIFNTLGTGIGAALFFLARGATRDRRARVSEKAART